MKVVKNRVKDASLQGEAADANVGSHVRRSECKSEAHAKVTKDVKVGRGLRREVHGEPYQFLPAKALNS